MTEICTEMPDYRQSPLARPTAIRLGAEWLALAAVIDLLFYRSLWLYPVLCAFLPFWVRSRHRQLDEKRRQRLGYDFREALDSLAMAMKAGYSVENAFAETERNLQSLLGEADLTREFRHMNARIRLNEAPDVLMADLAMRSGVEDIRDFASVFTAGRRIGGSMTTVIGSTAAVLQGRIEVNREIESALAAKKLEQKIMAVMPAFILVYMQITSPGFFDVMYETALGRILMTVCLVVYGLAIYIGARIVAIDI
ncbi:MAG: type II secretion system F family protein [Lachnospiraceae bacterium]|nr:type II secretion system F family protein [Lachnospiraceae bacterium]